MMRATTLRRFGSAKPDGTGVILSALHPAHRSGRTIFSSRVFAAGELPRVLKSGHHSRKIGKVVLKGAWRDMPIVTLTLEERATCPRSCAAWAECYGNNMQAAERVEPGQDLERMLWAELTELDRQHPKGFAVRLHVLGDFYSIGYVAFWEDALVAFPALRVFGFTARDPEHDRIGRAIAAITADSFARFAVRFSGMAGPIGASRMLDAGVTDDPEAITCPAQRGLTDCCATCALCWQTDRSIAFVRH